MADPRRFQTDAVLRDGSTIRLRALRPDDRERLQGLLSRVSSESAYFRFFGRKERLDPEDLVRLTELDFRREAALAATLPGEGGGEMIIGVGRYSAIPSPVPDAAGASPDRAEIAFLVEDAHQGRGIGTLLLEHLLPIARASGIDEFEAVVLGENNRMLEVFAKSGLLVQRAFDSGVFQVRFPVEENREWIEANARREREARAKSLQAILRPRSVAVVGASRTPGTVGAELLANLIRDGFHGKIYPVNPRATEIAGLRSYPSVAAIEEPIDLAVIAVPAPAVEEVLLDCARSSVAGVVVISAGFGETGPEGKDRERRILETARRAGMRLVGPNCLGVLNTDPKVALNATFQLLPPPPGNIGMLSQSGALGIAILDYLKGRALGVSSFVSVGNKSDVSGNDLLSFWAEDEATRVIVLYLESFGNPRKFARIAPEVARRKPVIAVKSGRSAAGSRAASSHSASLASLDVAVDALFEQAGVIRTDTLEQLFDVAALLSSTSVPRGPRVGVVTNAGGPGILLADACEAQGLKLPELAEGARAKLREFLPPQASLMNPVDMIASATAEHYERTIEEVGNDPGIDSLVVIYIPVLEKHPERIIAAIARGLDRVPLEKPALAVFLSSLPPPEGIVTPARGRIPIYTFPENAALALAKAERYGRWRSRPEGKVLSLEPFRRSAVRAVIDRALGTSKGAGVWLETEDLALILKAVGIEFAACERSSPERAPEIAARMGFPLVAKAVAPGLLHKSDAGGVALGLDSPAAVDRAVREMTARIAAAGHRLEGVLLQRQIRGGIEALVGVTTDPTFGPLVVTGLGGVLVELQRDVAFRLPPVSDLDAEEMLGKLRAQKLLDGYRGAPAGDRKALSQVLQRVSALVELAPEIQEMDLNPVLVLPPGQGAIAVDGRMRLGSSV